MKTSPLSLMAINTGGETLRIYGVLSNLGTDDKSLIAGLQAASQDNYKSLIIGFANSTAVGGRASQAANPLFASGTAYTLTCETASLDNTDGTGLRVAVDGQAAPLSHLSTDFAPSLPANGRPGFRIDGGVFHRQNNGITELYIDEWDETATPPVTASISILENVIDTYRRAKENHGTELLHITGTGTNWLTTAPAFTLDSTSAASGASLSSVTVTSNTAATVELNPGNTAERFVVTASTGGSAEVLLMTIQRVFAGVAAGKVHFTVPTPVGTGEPGQLSYQYETVTGWTGYSPTYTEYAGATAQAFEFSPANDDLVFVRCKATYKGQRPYYIAWGHPTWAAAGSRVVPTIPIYTAVSQSVASLAGKSLKLIVAGDSIAAGQDGGMPTTTIKSVLQTLTGVAPVVVNAAQGGSKWQDWQKGASSPHSADTSKNKYTYLKDQLVATGAKKLLLQLGTNNIGADKATVKTLATQFLEDLHADLPDVVIYLQYIMYRVGGVDGNKMLVDFNAVYEEIVAAHAYVKISAHSEVVQHFANNALVALADGLHPAQSPLGSEAGAKFWLKQIVADWITENPLTPPAVTAHPTSPTITAGQTATITATATNATGVTAQRLISGTWTNQSSATFNSGTGTASYTTPTLQTSDTGAQFRFVFTGASGTNPVSTNAATVTVTVNAATPGPGAVAAIVGSPVWQVETLSARDVLASQTVDLVVYIVGQAGPYRMLDNTGYPVEFAFVRFQDGATVTNEVWRAGTAKPDGTVRLLLGPMGLQLTAGTRYHVIVRVTSGGVQAILDAGFVFAK